MTKGNFIKVSGGVVIMFSVFLFLVTSKQVATNGPEIKTFFLGENKSQTAPVEQAILSNVVRGDFQLNTSKENKFIYSKRLFDKNINPVLKVQTTNGWEEIEWHTLDYEKGELYFKLPQSETYYTDKYQLIFN